MRSHFATRGGRHQVDLRLDGENLELSIDGADASRMRFSLDGDFVELESDGRRWRGRIARRGHEIYLHLRGRVWHLHEVDAQEQEDLAGASSDPVLRAPMPGRVLELLTELDAEVEAGTPLIRVEAMKMEVDLVAPLSGSVREIHVEVGQLVEPEALLITLEPQEP